MISFEEFAQHRHQVIEDKGEWAGILDGNGRLLHTLPDYTIMTGPENRNADSEVELSLPVVHNDGITHPVFSTLMGDNFGAQHADGSFQPITDRVLFVMIERRGGARHSYRLTHTYARGDDKTITELTLHGIGLIHILSRIPTFSRFHTTQPAGQQWGLIHNDYGRELDTPRYITQYSMMRTVDGAVHSGYADHVIAGIMRNGFQGVYNVFNIDDDNDKPYLVNHIVDKSTISPHVAIHVNDVDILTCIGEVARNTGVVIRPHFWLPTDERSDVHGDRTTPAIVYNVVAGPRLAGSVARG